MLKRLNTRLTLIYSFTISITITMVMIFAFSFLKYQLEQNYKDKFLDILSEIEFKLETEQKISQTWLSTTSSNYQIAINIEDNGKPVAIMKLIKSSIDQEEQDKLFDTLQTRALKDGMNTTIYPISFSKETSEVYYLESKNHKPYYGCVSLLTSPGSWHTIMLLQPMDRQKVIIRSYGYVFFLMDIIVIIFMFLFSRYFVGKTLTPVAESQQKQKEFIASASHELRSPLAVIRATLNSLILSEDAKEGEGRSCDRLKFYNDIDEEASRMSKLIDDLLIISSSQAKTWTLKKEVFDAEAFLIELYEAYSFMASDKGIQLKIELPEDMLATVIADKYRLRQALTVILDNAISYTPSGKTIIMKAQQKKHSLVISIIDQGIGIPQDKKAFIYDKFYRVDTSRIDKNHFGLGLTIAKELIELHDGKILLQDTSGGGSTFIIEIPSNSTIF